MNKVFITATVDIPLGQLLDEHLSSRFDASVILSSGGVWKDRKRIYDPQLIIQAKETIKVHTSTFQGKTYGLDRRDIMFENDDFLVVYKPPDLNVHQVPSSFYYNLTYAVNQYLIQQGTAFQSTPLTRLDRPVEGLVIFSKNKNYERRLFDLIQRRKIHKWYMAALQKGNDRACVRIRDTITNNGNRTVWDENGKHADSLFVKVNALDFTDIYSIFIFTGRRHQIRFHASQYLSPIIGDWFYGSSLFLQKDEIALICRGCNIPYKKKMLRIRLPEDYIERFYERIRKIK
ncbi:MAG: pseudouridine synthase family protein [Candidatus Omnitrophota bacterium]